MTRGETGEPVGIDWPATWRAVAARLGAHGAAGRGHLLTEDTVRFETVLELGARGVEAGRLAAEVLVPVLAGGKLDLVVDPPAGTVIEFKYPRDSRTGFSPDTMTFGELVRDFLRVAAVSATERWVVQVLNDRLLRYLIGVCRRHGFRWVDEPGDTLELHPGAVAALPKTATQAIGAAAATATVTARCVVAERVNPQLGLYAYRVDGLRIDGSADGEPLSDAEPLPAVPRTTPRRDVAVATRNGARREILEAARAIVNEPAATPSRCRMSSPRCGGAAPATPTRPSAR